MANNNDSLEVRVAVAEKDISNLGQILNRFDQALERMSDISASIKELLTAHDVKISTNAQISIDNTKKIAELEVVLNKKIDEVDDRITKIDYIKYFVMGVAVLILSKLNIPLPAL
jgi:hypothetical protein